MASGDELETQFLKETFRSVDHGRTGFFTRSDLANVFQELEEWTQSDLDELFDAVDTKKDGTLDYSALIDYIMAEDDDDEPDVEEEGEEDDDHNDSQMMSDQVAAVASGLSLNERVTRDEFDKMLRKLDVDANEADGMYDEIAREASQKGFCTEIGIMVKWFLDELGIDRKDNEGLCAVEKAIKEVRLGNLATAGAGEHALTIAAARLSQWLKKTGKPTEEAWGAMHGECALSNAGRRALTQKYQDDHAGLASLVRDYATLPPMLPSSAGQASNREECKAYAERLVQKCRATGVKFSDDEWNVEKNMPGCFYVDKEKPGWDCTVGGPDGFKRLSELSSNPVLFNGGVQAGDIKQGQIGTCFLLGALGAVAANKKDAIRRSFIYYDIELGIYAVRFCVDGEWTYVIVDDLVPVDKYGRVLFARSADPDEVWCPIFEKAYCKLNTCYEMCDGGRANQAIYAVCGGVSGKFAIDDKMKKNPDAYFNLMQNARSRGWLMTTTFVINKKAKAGTGKCGESVLPTGLVGGHVYSVLGIVDECGVKLVCCRNPWGTGEWKGKYSDENSTGEWTQDLKNATGWAGKNDGKFWMSLQDFVDNSGGVEYSRSFGPQWKKITLTSSFQSGSLKATTVWAYKSRADNELGFAKGSTVEVLSINPGWWHGNVEGCPEKKGFFPGNYVKLKDRPIARFDLSGTPATGMKALTAVVQLMQPNSKMKRKFYKRKDNGMNYKDVSYPSIQLVIVGPDGKVALKRAGKKRSISGELLLPGGGLWRVYALSLDGRGADFTLRTYVRDGTATLKAVEGATIAEITKAISG